MKITKSQLAQIIKEEMGNTLAEHFTTMQALSAVKDAEVRGVADAQEDFERLQTGGEVLQIDATEKTPEEEDAYNKGWQDEMDRLQQEPPPETDADREAAQAEYDFESHFSEGKKITKSQLARIVKEELAAVTAEGYKAYKRDDKKPKRGKKGLEEDLAPYSGLEGYVLQTLSTLGGEQPVVDIASVAGEAWAADNWSDDDLIDEEDMFYSVQEALENLQDEGKVHLTQGGPGSTDEDFYALA